MTKKYEFNCGCGCLTVLIEICAFILICNLFGCSWAEHATEKGVHYVKGLIYGQ